MEFYFDEETRVSSELLDTMKHAAEIACSWEGLDPDRLEISISFVDPERIQELNRIYRENDSVTDVLSFPQFERPEEIAAFSWGGGTAEIGDVVICRERAEEQAKEFGHSFERELVYLFVHSVLHLLGYDHEEPEEKRVMRGREEEIMEELGIPREPEKQI